MELLREVPAIHIVVPFETLSELCGTWKCILSCEEAFGFGLVWFGSLGKDWGKHFDFSNFHNSAQRMSKNE